MPRGKNSVRFVPLGISGLAYGVASLRANHQPKKRTKGKSWVFSSSFGRHTSLWMLSGTKKAGVGGSRLPGPKKGPLKEKTRP